MYEQSKLESTIETSLNIGSGFILAYSTWLFVIIPLIEKGYLSIDDSLIITSIFTVITFVRSYFWRRMFTTKKIHLIAEWLQAEWYYFKKGGFK